MTDKNTYVRKGDIFFVKLGTGTEKNSNVQHGGSTGFRPCIVVNNKIACNVSPVLLVVPITSSSCKVKNNMPTHLELDGVLPKKSVALFEQVLTIDRYQLKNKIAHLPDKLLKQVDEKLKITFGLVPQFA